MRINPGLDAGRRGGAAAALVLVAGFGCRAPVEPARVASEPAPPLFEGRAGRNEAAAESRELPVEDAKTAALEAARAAGEAQDPPTESPSEPSNEELKEEARRVLDDWHRAAAEGDEKRYLGHFALDGVFMGPDPDERWDLATFSSYVREAFGQGKNWANEPLDRHLLFGPKMDVAWFDEKLDSGGYTGVRGTGVLRRADDSWKIVHYSLTYTIPSEIARDVVNSIKALSGSR